MKKAFVLAAIILAAALTGRAQLVTYNFEVDVNTPSALDGNLDASDFSLSSGAISYAAGSAGRAISGQGWSGAAGTKYWEFMLTANSGVTLDISELSFDYRATGTGPSNWEVSINGNPAGSGTFVRDSIFHSESLIIDAFSGVSSAQVRLTGFGGTGGSGTWRLDNVVLDGLAVTPVPEPSTWALLGGGLLFLAHRLRRRK